MPKSFFFLNLNSTIDQIISFCMYSQCSLYNTEQLMQEKQSMRLKVSFVCGFLKAPNVRCRDEARARAGLQCDMTGSQR